MLPAHSCAKFWCIRALKGPAPPCSAVPAAGVHRMRSCRRSCRIWLAAALHSSGREQTPLRRRRTHVDSHPRRHNRMVVIVWSATAFSYNVWHAIISISTLLGTCFSRVATVRVSAVPRPQAVAAGARGMPGVLAESLVGGAPRSQSTVERVADMLLSRPPSSWKVAARGVGCDRHQVVEETARLIASEICSASREKFTAVVQHILALIVRASRENLVDELKRFHVLLGAPYVALLI